MGGTRFLPMSITAIRLLIAVVALMHAGTAPWTHWAGALADFYILAWAVAGLGGFLLGLPRTRSISRPFRFAWQSCQIELAVSRGCLFGAGVIRAIGLKGKLTW